MLIALWHISCVLFSELLRSVVWHLILVWGKLFCYYFKCFCTFLSSSILVIWLIILICRTVLDILLICLFFISVFLLVFYSLEALTKLFSNLKFLASLSLSTAKPTKHSSFLLQWNPWTVLSLILFDSFPPSSFLLPSLPS